MNPDYLINLLAFIYKFGLISDIINYKYDKNHFDHMLKPIDHNSRNKLRDRFADSNQNEDININ